jgi:hypothetical protein
MHTHTWSFDAGYCRFKTVRRKKRLQKADYDKQLLRLDRRRDKLELIKRTLPPVPLAEAYQKGWKRTFVLSADTARCKQADFYATLLCKINTVDYATEKHFRRKLKEEKTGRSNTR